MPLRAISNVGPVGTIEVALIAAGPFHDIEYVRSQLLGLLGGAPRIRSRIFENYDDINAIVASNMIVSYTCDVTADAAQSAALRDWLDQGGHWLALHATNATLAWIDGQVASPDRAPEFMELLGTSFAAHPPVGPYRVEVSDPEHPLVRGLKPFEVCDEQYLGEIRAPIHVLLDSFFEGETPRFQTDQWPAARHPVLYLRELGQGVVLYLTLGHCVVRAVDVDRVSAPEVPRCSWDEPIFHELLERGLSWLVERRDNLMRTKI